MYHMLLVNHHIHHWGLVFVHLNRLIYHGLRAHPVSGKDYRGYRRSLSDSSSQVYTQEEDNFHDIMYFCSAFSCGIFSHLLVLSCSYIYRSRLIDAFVV